MENQINVPNLMKYVDKLPDFEADILNLYYTKEFSQRHIADIFGCTQAAISYRIKKAIKRVEFFTIMPTISEIKMITDLSKILEPLNVQIMTSMYRTSSQLATGKELGISQGKVRHHFLKSIKTIEQSEYREPYADIFNMIMKKKNIMHEVVLPQWQFVKRKMFIDCVPENKQFYDNVKIEVSGKKVKFTDGLLKNLEGNIISQDPDTISAMIKLRSCEINISLPNALI